MITLPASNDIVLAEVINPALEYLPPVMRSDQARCELLAIGRQESGFAERQQIGGPARSLWQFERAGVLAVMRNSHSADYVFHACGDFGIQYGSGALYNAIAADDVLACVLARLMLWTDPRPLPELNDVLGAWNYYERNWEPGKPNYSRWKQTAYPQAVATIAGASA